MNNRLWNSKNPNQGEFKKTLCVCSAGLLRSPTLAFIMSKSPYNRNTRAAGVDTGHALIPVDEVLLTWADEIFCMDRMQKILLEDKLYKSKLKRPVISLDVPDMYEYRDPKLIQFLEEALLKRGVV